MAEQRPELPLEQRSVEDPIEAVITVLIREGSPQELMQQRLKEETLKAALDIASRANAMLDRIIGAILPNGLPGDDTFYGKLEEVEFRLGHVEEEQRLAGLLWSRVFERATAGEQQVLLRSMTEPGVHFFAALEALPVFIERCFLPADKLTDWIVAIRAKLGNDLAGGGFWKAIQRLSETWPDNALAVAERLGGLTADDNCITISAAILGHLRVAHPELDGKARFENALAINLDVNRRLVFHRSWITTGLHRKLEDVEFETALNRMSTGTAEEINEAFNFIRCLLPTTSLSDISFRLAVEWLHAHTSASVSDFWKHFVLSIVKATYDRWKSLNALKRLFPLYDLSITIQPIAPKHIGTWRELENLLVMLAKADRAEFQRVLFAIARSNLSGLVEHLRQIDEFRNLASVLRSSYANELAAEALLSADEAICTLGFVLFDTTGADSLPLAPLRAASDEAIAAVIFAFRLQPFYDEVIPRFLLAILPRVMCGSHALKELLSEEMLFQCKNLPGACLDTLKKTAKRRALVKAVTKKADDYFDQLRTSHRSAVNSMEVAGLRRATRLRAVRESRTMNAQVREKSVFTQLFSTSYLLYGGKTWRTFLGGQLGQPSEMKEFSTSAEFPRMPMIDPDGLAQRVQNAHRMRKSLLHRIAAS
jgi:hypothetical protein